MKIEKDNLFRFLRRLTKELSNKFADLKSDFEKNPPPNNEIKKRFLVLVNLWRNGEFAMTRSWLRRWRKCRKWTRRLLALRTTSSRLLRSSETTMSFWYQWSLYRIFLKMWTTPLRPWRNTLGQIWSVTQQYTKLKSEWCSLWLF